MLSFKKMHGCGNDFVVIDARKSHVTLSESQVRHLADRRFGVGCDQLAVMTASDKADCFMHIYNHDGSKVATCGNATRCVGDILLQESGKDIVAIETEAGVLSVAQNIEYGLTVSMGKPRMHWRDIPLSESRNTLHLGIEDGVLMDPVAISMGNPHMVFFVKNLDLVRMAESGPRLEMHKLFPEKANVSAVQLLSGNHIKQIVWERGAGLTLACGSAACAAVVAGVERGLLETNVQVDMPGGTLWIDWQKNTSGEVLMSGAVAHVFEGKITI